MVEPIDIQTPPNNLHELFEIALPELQSLPADRYVRRSVSRARTLELSKILIGNFSALVDVVDTQLSPLVAEQRKLELGRLRTRTWVFYKADLASEETHANTVRKQRRALRRAVTGHDRFLFKWAMPVLGDDPEHAETLRDISRGTGARDDAEDVLRLADLYLANWDRLEPLHHIVTRSYIETAVADATQLLDMLTRGASNPARKLADAAYSLWYHDYNQLMHLGRYLARGDDDVTARFPGVRELMTTRSDEPDDAEADMDIEAEEDIEAGEAVEESPQPVEDPVADPNAAA